jgi:hypothetical protein
MIFSGSFIFMNGLTGGAVIAVYSGTQPTMADYISNYTSSYGFSSSDLLQIVLTGGITKPGDSAIIETNSNNSGYTQGLYSIRSGTGTWATIRPASAASYNVLGYYTLTSGQAQSAFGSTPSQNSSVIIVPISDLSGTGVIKFNSTTFSHPDTDQEDRAWDLKIKISA